jgi:fructose-bisphosphate aldolase/2-amino-3,7-dideoxy-D-threo-hept-6-ulosonate synthase
MTSLGKRIRMERIFNRATNRTIIVPMDHGLTIGTTKGIANMPWIINEVANGGANAVVVHAGIAENGHRGSAKVENTRDIGLIIHLSGSTRLSPNSTHKVLVCSVEEAIRLGADAVSIHINIGADDEPAMLEQMGQVSMACRHWGMPLIAMMYPRGPNVKDEHLPDVVNLAARAGAELGADIVKTNYTGNIDSFREIVKGCPVPVIVAGGPKMDNTRALLETVHDAINAGAAGIAMGRNIFEHSNPRELTKSLSLIIHENYTVEEAIKETKII